MALVCRLLNPVLLFSELCDGGKLLFLIYISFIKISHFYICMCVWGFLKVS